MSQSLELELESQLEFEAESFGNARGRRQRMQQRRCRCGHCAACNQHSTQTEVDTEFELESWADSIGSAVRSAAGTVADVVGNTLGGVDGSRIIDLTAKADKSNRKGVRDPKKVYALVLHQMACCANRKDPLKSYLKIGSHFAILRDGKILQLHPISALVWASNGFNSGSVAVEFAGNFPSTRGKWWKGEKYGKNQVTPAQVEAGRYLIAWLHKSMGLTHVLAHRQSSGTRENDPGPDIWYHVGQWAIDKFGLKDGGPGFKIDSGNPIPDEWRRWNKPVSSATPSKELEFKELEFEDEWSNESSAHAEYENINPDFEIDSASNSGEFEWEEERRSTSRPRARGPIRKPNSRPTTRPTRPRLFGGQSQVSTCNCPNVCPTHGTESARWLQSALNRTLNLRLPITGIIDAATRSAVRRFQEQQGLPVDGIAGPDVESALLNFNSSSTSDTANELEFEWEEEVSRSSRDYIIWVQSSLNRLMNAGLVEDGISGSLTRAAVQNFQRRQGLDADGIVGPVTESALIQSGATSPPGYGGTPSTSPPSTTPVAVNTPLPASGTGYYSYTSAEKRYGTAATIGALQAIASAWNQAHPSGPRLGIGNISMRGGGQFPPHSTHREGLNADIRPVRSDRGESPVTYQDSSYSRALTQELVNLIFANPVLGVSSILFNDPSVQRVKAYQGHDNHLHVTFNRPTSSVPASTVPATTPGSSGSLRTLAAQIALQERKRWRDGALKEWDDAARSILVDYWLTGVGMAATDAARFADELYAWSAAFISWVLRKAGAGSQFTYSSYHSNYISAAYKNRLQNSSNPFKAFAKNEVAPQVGDLVCTTYVSNGVQPPSDLAQVRANTSGYHCDIVVASSAGKLTVIGGNLSDSVGLKTVSIDSRGYITDSSYFAVLRTG
jgi:peptidoglycan hydrolase-like protein with peptidoglycan-binding domain